MKRQQLLDKLNTEIIKCRNCQLHVTRHQVLTGEGASDAKLFLVALSPGEQEDREGRMFIGPSGQVLDKLLAAAGLNREELYISNLIKCNLPQNRKPKMVEIEACHQYLDSELEIIQPEFIITLGFYAGRYILEKYHWETPSAKSDYHELYGKLIYASGQKILVLPHPASLLYKPEFWQKTQQKYHKMKILGTECKWFSCCPMRKYYESGKLIKSWIELYCHGDWQSCIRYQMEERGQYHPDWMLPDGNMDDNLK